MKILKHGLVLALLVFQACLGVNSPEFKEAVALLNQSEMDKSKVLLQLHKLVKKNSNIVTEKEDGTGNTLLHYSKLKIASKINDFFIRKGAHVATKNKSNQNSDEFAMANLRIRSTPSTQQRETRPREEEQGAQKKKKQEKPILLRLEPQSLDLECKDIFDDFDRISSMKAPKNVLDAYGVFDLDVQVAWKQVAERYEDLLCLVNPSTNRNRSLDASQNTEKLNAAYDILQAHYGY